MEIEYHYIKKRKENKNKKGGWMNEWIRERRYYWIKEKRDIGTWMNEVWNGENIFQ